MILTMLFNALDGSLCDSDVISYPERFSNDLCLLSSKIKALRLYFDCSVREELEVGELALAPILGDPTCDEGACGLCAA